jgi:hypothetical protein
LCTHGSADRCLDEPDTKTCPSAFEDPHQGTSRDGTLWTPFALNSWYPCKTLQMATLAVQEAMGLKVDREAVATLVLPQLWAMSIGPCRPFVFVLCPHSSKHSLDSAKRRTIPAVYGRYQEAWRSRGKRAQSVLTRFAAHRRSFCHRRQWPHRWTNAQRWNGL